jgi:hypothetical protein
MNNCLKIWVFYKRIKKLKIESKTKTVQRIFLFLRSKLKVPGAIGTKQNENKYIMKELPQKNSSEN